METPQNWFLLKHEDGSIFGPKKFSELYQWAARAKISPLDKVSNDEKVWVKAPMIPGLEMDYLVETDAGQYYGPTTLGALKEFLREGEIHPDTVLLNCRDSSVRAVSEFPEFAHVLAQITGEHAEPTNQPEEKLENEEPQYPSTVAELQERLRETESLLAEESERREQAEAELAQLQQEFPEQTAGESAAEDA